MECALIDRAVAKEAKRDAIFVAIFRGESHSDRERNVRADNRVTAIHVLFLVEEMHRTAEPARAAGLLSEKLRHAGVRARAAGQRVRVIAISGDEVIIVAHRGATAPATTASWPM